jgi:hypothetical protein
MAHHYISFVNSPTDWPLVNSVYSESAGCRVSLQSVLLNTPQIPPRTKLWLDCGVDGLHFARAGDPQDETNPAYSTYIRQFENFNHIADSNFQRKPDKATVSSFVNQVLDKAVNSGADPHWLSVPQLPYTGDTDRKKINRFLAQATNAWKVRQKYGGKLILPVILTKSGETDRKTGRNPIVGLASECFVESGASGFWVVDSTLDDQDGVKNFENERFPGIIKLHEELNSKLPGDTVSVGGPYWGLNLVIWARGLIRFSAIGVGRSYKYYMPGGRQQEAKPRIALPPLRRLAVWSPELKAWLETVLRKLSKSDQAYQDFSALLRNFQLLSTKIHARRQVARFYGEWLKKLESVPPSSRALTLYQDLSAAYVLGTALPPLPEKEKVKNPARIAKQLMVNCL